MDDVFLIYAREDKPLAERLVAVLQGAGCSVSWDPGPWSWETWRSKTRFVARRAPVSITLWTETAVRSAWVISEATMASEFPASRYRSYFAIPVDDATIPPPFDGFPQLRLQARDLADDQPSSNLAVLIESVTRALEPRKSSRTHWGPKERLYMLIMGILANVWLLARHVGLVALAFLLGYLLGTDQLHAILGALAREWHALTN